MTMTTVLFFGIGLILGSAVVILAGPWLIHWINCYWWWCEKKIEGRETADGFLCVDCGRRFASLVYHECPKRKALYAIKREGSNGS